jgi:bla regulator protein blaR1
MTRGFAGIATSCGLKSRQPLWCAFTVAYLGAFGIAHAQTPAAQTSAPIPEWQTASGGHMEFEVASIHLGDPAKFIPPSFALSIDDAAIPPGGHFKADFQLAVYIEFAYKVQLAPEQFEAMLAHQPDWIRSQLFVIEAEAPITNPTKDQMRLMIQALLAERFKLAMHFETREMPVLALVLARPDGAGPRLRPHEQGPACDAPWTAPSDPAAPTVPPGGFLPKCGMVAVRPGPHQTILQGARGINVENIALYLPTVYKFGRPVVDQTGLKGAYDFSLNWAPDSNTAIRMRADDNSEAEGPEFFDALKDQLGLKLKPARAPVEFLVIDHVEQPSAN